jgi:hypothetical protein
LTGNPPRQITPAGFKNPTTSVESSYPDPATAHFSIVSFHAEKRSDFGLYYLDAFLMPAATASLCSTKRSISKA